MPRRTRKKEKEKGFIPISAESEMSSKRESSIPVPVVTDVPINSSWVPMTPVKPIQPKLSPIYTESQENQLNQSNWSVPVRYSTEFSKTNNGFGFSMEPNNQFISIFNSKFEGNQFQASLATQDADSVPSQSTYDLHSQHGALEGLSSSINIPSPFAPITPDKSKKAENKQAYNIHSLSLDENANRERDTIGNEVDTSGVEVEVCHQDKQQLRLNDLSGAAVSTQLQENHNPDNGSNPGIDQNRTPQQKPRRRKHRPKVVIEGQPKRTRKPPTPQPTGPKENPNGKRKYVRKNKLEKIPGTPSAEVTSGPTDSVPAARTTKSCRRTLNFDSESQAREESSMYGSQSDTVPESQAQNFPTRVLSKSTVQLDEGMEVMVEKTQVGIAYELVQSMNKVLQDYISMPERQDPIPQTPTKTDLPNENWKTDVQNEHAGGKCQIVFSDGSACLTGGDQVKGLKRGNSCMNYDVEARRADLIGAHYSSSHGYLGMFPANVYNYYGIPNICFPGINKKMRFEQGHSSTTSSILSTVTIAETNVRLRQVTPRPLHNGWAACSLSAACSNTSSTSTKITPLDALGRQQAFECKLGMDQKGRMEKRSKGPSRLCNLGSQVDLIEGIRLPTFQAEGAPTIGNMQGYEILEHPYTCMEGLVGNTHATMTTKKQTKTNYSADSVTTDMYNQSLVNSTDAFRKRIPWIREIFERLKNLDITNQQQSALVPYNLINGEQSSLVLYKRDGTVVPFGGSFNPVRKRRPRPKVDLDDETSRVWKLLLDNINSEGIDGSDEEKVRWWEEERRVFRGRADSFIARMHLIQGDRRFSPWKGSVVDSVVGVFLTQNVSDHLSSSAFMSVASRFPLKPKSKDSPCFGETSVLPNEPDMCILDPQNTIKWQQHKEKSNQPAWNGNSIAFHHMDCYSEKVVNSNEFLGSSSTGGKSLDSLKCKCSDISANGLEMYHESTANKAMIQLKESVASFMGDKREVDDVQSSQYSGDSSQSSLDSSMVQTAERIGSCLQDKFEAADLAARSKPNSQLSFMELLLQAESLRSRKTGYKSSFKENQYSCMESTAHNMQNQDKSESDNSTQKPIIPSHLQMIPTSGMLEAESFKMVGEDILSSDNSMVSEENCTSEQSGVTAESVTQAMIQKTETASFQEASKSPCEKNHACSSLQRQLDKIFQSQNRQVGNPKDNVHSQTQEHDCRMQEVVEIPDVSRESLDITESTNVINDPQINEHKKVESSLTDHCCLPDKTINGTSSDRSKVKKRRIGKQEQINVDWDSLRLQAQEMGKRERTTNTMDSLDWEAVWRADVNELAETIKERGMNNRLAGRIKDFLNRLVRDHGSIDLEWLRDVPPDKAKEYLLSIQGLGLKSVECVRLLTLHHLAFPVDTNVGRIAVRLGWVPLQPLPESLQLHLLELYPVLESIQRYLWPRLCKLDQRTLYELHYQMITFGKVFCTKSKPNCNACPLRGECRHFASAFASARLALPGPEEKSIVSATEKKADNENMVKVIKPLRLPLPQSSQELQAQSRVITCEPIIEEPASPEPIVEVPATPEHEQPQVPESDIEDAFWEDPEEIPLIKLNIEEFTQNLQNYMQQNMELQEGDVSKALVALTSEAASIPTPKLKNVNRLRTEHQVYELPDLHPLLEGLDKREPDDPCPYLLAIWTPGETANSIQPPEIKCTSQEFGKLCDQKECFSCNSIREANTQTVRGTLLIPCRTAMRGSFPLNGTYFQVNEVFADHESSICPIDVPRAWLWNLPRRTVYFGTSMPSIFKGLSTEGIQYCFWRGFVCVRGFDQKTRAPRPLMARLHFPVSKLPKTKGTTNDKQETKGKISNKQE